MVTNKRQKIDEECQGITVIDSGISPQEFFNDYVISRQPVKFSNLINDDNWRGDKWTNDVLREKSGMYVCMYICM
jgi:hypothetical protein